MAGYFEPVCDEHGTSGIRKRDTPKGPQAFCDHCEADADLKREENMSAAVDAVVRAVCRVAKEGSFPEEADDLRAALLNLVREARR